MPAADFGEVPTQAVFAKDTKSRLFTKRVLKKEHSNTAAFTICTSNVNCFILVVRVIEVCIQYVSC